MLCSLEMSQQSLLDVQELVVEFPVNGGRHAAVDGICLVLEEGEILGLVGESGCGKSLTAMALIDLVPAPGRIRSGVVRLDGEDVLGVPPRQRRRFRGAGLAYVPQEPGPALNPVLKVGSQIADVVRAHRDVSRAAAWTEAERALERVGIPQPRRRVNAYPHELSGGMKQRVLIALALAARPRVLLADEPTTAVDVTLQAGLLDLLRSLVDQGEVGGVVLITHDLAVVANACDRVSVMYAGRIVEEAPVESLFEAPVHPYTKALLRSIPTPAHERGALPTVPGQVPDLRHRPPGCAFHPRCDLAEAACRSAVPALVRRPDGRRFACLVEERR
jgi:oligopeptide/dipeptide ABC transporter ATP-binding protein